MVKQQVKTQQITGKASSLSVDFGNGILKQLAEDGKNIASAKNYIKIGDTLIQWTTVQITLSAANTNYQWNATWPLAFSSVDTAFVSPLTGWISSVTGGMETLSNTGASGYFLGTTAGSFPRTITIYLVGIGK